jgi:hypothetical protein
MGRLVSASSLSPAANVFELEIRVSPKTASGNRVLPAGFRSDPDPGPSRTITKPVLTRKSRAGLIAQHPDTIPGHYTMSSYGAISGPFQILREETIPGERPDSLRLASLRIGRTALLPETVYPGRAIQDVLSRTCLSIRHPLASGCRAGQIPGGPYQAWLGRDASAAARQTDAILPDRHANLIGKLAGKIRHPGRGCTVAPRPSSAARSVKPTREPRSRAQRER